MAEPLRARTRRTPVLERIVMTAEGTSISTHFVLCVARGKTVTLASCERCPHLLLEAPQAIGGGLVVSCAPPTR